MQWGVTMDECGRGAGAQRLRERGRHAGLCEGSVRTWNWNWGKKKKRKGRGKGREGKGKEEGGKR